MALFDSGVPLANVALSDTFNTWRVRTNQINTQAAGLASNNTFTGTLNTFNNTASFKGPVTAPIITANTVNGTAANFTTLQADSIDFDGDLTVDGVTANTFSGDGSSLTALNASQITSGTIPDARIQASGVTQHQASITGTGALNSGSITSGFGNINIGTSTFTGNGSGLTTLNASNISSGTIADAYLPATISSDITGNAATATSATSATSATNATNATNFDVAADNTTNATHYPVFVGGATGNQRPNSDTGLTYNPSTGVLTSVDFNATSDVTYKEDIQDIVNPLDIINSISGKMFTWKHTGKKSYGVIAQEVEKVLPDVVNENENGKSVNYNTLIAVLIESNKLLSEKIKRLEEKL